MEKINRINWLDFIIPIAIWAVFTLIFRFTDLDLNLQAQFWQKGTGWFLKHAQPWDFIYHYSNLPALAIAIVSLVGLVWGFFQQKLRKYRKICLFLVLGMIVGPGLIVNSLLKENWGRPRPRNIQNFGGKYQYEQVLEIDPSSSGKSFPSGHASIGFYFFILFLLLRREQRKWAIVFLIFGILFGGLIGVARIVQGGHFFSDIIWSGGLGYLSSAALYYLLGIHRSIFYHSSHPINKHK